MTDESKNCIKKMEIVCKIFTKVLILEKKLYKSA
jgi:hypothetical protein